MQFNFYQVFTEAIMEHFQFIFYSYIMVNNLSKLHLFESLVPKKPSSNSFAMAFLV